MMNTQFGFLRVGRVDFRGEHERAVLAVAHDAHRPELEQHVDLDVDTGTPAAGPAVSQIGCLVGDEDESWHGGSLSRFSRVLCTERPGERRQGAPPPRPRLISVTFRADPLTKPVVVEL